MTLLRHRFIAVSTALALLVAGCTDYQNQLGKKEKTQAQPPQTAPHVAKQSPAQPPTIPSDATATTQVSDDLEKGQQRTAEAVEQRVREEDRYLLDQSKEVQPATPATEAMASTSASASAPASDPAPMLRQDSREQGMDFMAAPAIYPDYSIPPPPSTEKYAHDAQSPVKLVAEQPVSTFSIDVDTGSYANVRRFLREGQLPPPDAVRVEEMLNYFTYDYPRPVSGAAPFAVSVEAAPAPWNVQKQLLRIGIKGRDLAKETLPAVNLVFLIDVSGSMEPADRLPLLQSALKIFMQSLRAQDRVSMVVYAGGVGVVLPPTSGADKATLSAALSSLQAGGSTNGEGGIQLAYAMAQQGYIPGGINRILLATDGDFNVGTTDFEALKNLVAEKRKTGVSLSTLGFGRGNLNDQLMEQIADVGNGNYSYIDTLNEAQKVLVDEFTSTLATIAKDVKIQVEFNPEVVAEYRLIGYENRALKREDFNNDTIDAGEIGAGHTVTALYEIGLINGSDNLIDPLRYQKKEATATVFTTASKGDNGGGDNAELAFLRLRFKQPDSEHSELLEIPLANSSSVASVAAASDDFRFATAVSAFGQLLHGGKYTGEYSYADVLQLAQGARGADAFGYRSEFLSLVNLARSLAVTASPVAQYSFGEDDRGVVLQ